MKKCNHIFFPPRPFDRFFHKKCLKCGAIKIGKHTITVTDSYLDIGVSTTDPSLVSGRVWVRDTAPYVRFSPDGITVRSMDVDHHKNLNPIDHPDGSILPAKLNAVNTPSGGQVPSYHATTGNFEWITPTGGAGGPDWMQYYKSGRWYYGLPIGGSIGSSSTAANRLYAFPFFTPVQSSWDAIGIYVYTAATGYARLGVYADNGDIYPGNLILDAGEVDTGTTGAKTLSITLTLSPGLYWLALLTSAAPSLQGHSSSYGYGCIGAPGLGSTPPTGYIVSYTYGSLPTQFPSGAGITNMNYVVALRKV